MGKGKRLRLARTTQEQSRTASPLAGPVSTESHWSDSQGQALFDGIPPGTPGFPGFVVPGAHDQKLRQDAVKRATAAPSRRIVERATSESDGRISQTSGTEAQRYLGRAAHYLWWTKDLDSPTDVALRIIRSGAEPDVIWGLRWGPPWNSGIVTRAVLEAKNLIFPTGMKETSIGKVLEWLLYAGASRGELVSALEYLDIDDLAWYLSWAALIEERSAASHLATVTGSPRLHDLIESGGSQADRLAVARRALIDGGLTTASVAEGLAPADDEGPLPSISEAGEWILDAWKEYGELREDGLQRIDEARSRGGDKSLTRDALGVLHSACLAGEEALASHRSAALRPSFSISSGAAMLADCYRDAAYTAGWLGDLDEAIRLAERATELGYSSLEVEMRAKTRQNLGHLLTRRGSQTDCRRALDCFLEAETYYRACGADDIKIMRAIAMKGLALQGLTDPEILRKGPGIELPGDRRGRSRPRHTAHEPMVLPLGGPKRPSHEDWQ